MKKFFIFFILILFSGFFLRLYNLTQFPIFGDEAIYIRWAQQMRQFPELRFVSLTDGKQPLFMWSIIPFSKFFADPLFAGRIVSVITGTITMLGVFFLTFILFFKVFRHPDFDPKITIVKFISEAKKDHNSQKAALLATLLYAVSPFTVFFDRMALADSMLAMFGVWTLIFGLLTVLLIRLDMAILTGFALGGAMLTKSPAMFFAILLPSIIIYRILKDKKIDFFDRNLIFISPLFVITYIISYGFYNILRLGPSFHMLEQRTLDYVHPIIHIFESPLDPFLPHIDRVKEYILILGPGLIFILLALGIFQLYKKNKAALIVLVLWSIVPILFVSAYTKVMTARYVYFSIPYLFVISSAVIYYRNPVRKAIYTGALLFIILSLRWNWYYHTDHSLLPLPSGERSGYLEEWTSGIGIPESAGYIKDIALSNPEVNFVVGTEGYFGSLPQGIDIYLQNLPNVEVYGVGGDINKIPDQLIEEYDQGKKVYLVTNASTLTFDPSSESEGDLTLELISEFPKVKPPDEESDKLMLFEVR